MPACTASRTTSCTCSRTSITSGTAGFVLGWRTTQSRSRATGRDSRRRLPTGVDAGAVGHTNQKIYFFKGDRVHPRRSQPTAGTSIPGIRSRSLGTGPGFPPEFASRRRRGACSKPNQKIYFFKGSQYIRVDPEQRLERGSRVSEADRRELARLPGRLCGRRRQRRVGGDQPADLLLQGHAVHPRQSRE